MPQLEDLLKKGLELQEENARLKAALAQQKEINDRGFQRVAALESEVAGLVSHRYKLADDNAVLSQQLESARQIIEDVILALEDNANSPIRVPEMPIIERTIAAYSQKLADVIRKHWEKALSSTSKDNVE